ncbi:MAG: NADH:flavin oxidoreductase [Spirochaetales bacterium]|nr:NADH:flavin oxidoreductase [Spirochaetales bacterium]
MKNDQYRFVFHPLPIKKITIPNRIFFPPLSLHWANLDGTVSEDLFRLYENLAKGGCGMIITGVAVISDESGATSSYAHDRRMHISDDKYIPGLRKLFGKIVKHGSVPSIQLCHSGRQAISSRVPRIAPSAIPSPMAAKFDPNYSVREMTLEDIEIVKNDFVKAARRAVEAGAKAIQLHCGHGYLLNQFLSTYSNKRNDKYGGNIANRLRFVLEIIKEIKTQIHDDFILDVRISANEFVENGLEPEDYSEIAPLLENAGVDIINVSFGVLETLFQFLSDSRKGPSAFIAQANQIKKYVSIPVGYCSFIDSIEKAEMYLSQGMVDLIGMGRAQFADNDIVKKTKGNRENEIRKCLWDNKCILDLFDRKSDRVYCTINPDYQRKNREIN